MKKVRFETPTNCSTDTMQDYECHSPRPFIERQIVDEIRDNVQSRVVFSNDPLHRFENSNSSPYPIANKTYLNAFPNLEDRKLPSTDLDLSMLDGFQSENRLPVPKTNTLFRTLESNRTSPNNVCNGSSQPQTSHKILASIENKIVPQPPNMQSRGNDFFIRRSNLGKFSVDPLHPAQLDKENNLLVTDPLVKKNALVKMGSFSPVPEKVNYIPNSNQINADCRCHHCVKIDHSAHRAVQNNNRNGQHVHSPLQQSCHPHYCRTTCNNCNCSCNQQIVPPECFCNKVHQSHPSPANAVDKKTWAIEKYEKTKKCENSEVDKPNMVLKEKREPTVSDLFKIIKLQNEQLQMLQEKVDKFITAHTHQAEQKQKLPIQNVVTEKMAVHTMNSEQHKISIGVMTSFEMVHTSTVINKEIVKQCEAQIQCNRSQISIKEVFSKKQAGNLNFLDGIPPVSKNVEAERMQLQEGLPSTHTKFLNNVGCPVENVVEDRTLNELSLYNVQIDNSTTPMMSPEQSLYLDIRDYSESDSGSDDQSNVGWTYYNKVMTHVNGMLQESDMPSSASALYRHTKQKCMQVQVDKNNVSVGKRVTFGDDPFGAQQQPITVATDTSLKMKQLAAKYLADSPAITPSPRAVGEMSFATRNYMERHKLLKGQNAPMQQDIPRFLDITALKQQPKLI